MSTDLIVAGGCLVTRGDGPDREVLIVHRPKYDDWSLPKGKQLADEHVTVTAVREVEEETGVVVALRQPLQSHEYKVGGAPKVVHYWRAAVVTDKEFEPNSEVDEISWLPIEAACQRLTQHKDAALARTATEPSTTPFVVLRHGHATKRADWSGDDTQRPLNPSGFLQAEELVSRLGAYGITAVHSSASTRCVQTVTPYATAVGLPVVLEPELTQEAYADDPDAAQARATGLLADALRRAEPTVLCGHRPYLPDLLNHLLRGSDLVAPQDTVPTGSMLVIHGLIDDLVAFEHHTSP